MNLKRVKQDLELILPHYQRTRQRQSKSTWLKHTWRTLPDGSFEILLVNYPLPPNARPRRTSLKIEGPKCLYDPTNITGQFHFYRNIWVGDEIQVRIPGQQDWGKLPRIHFQDKQKWFFVCIHPGTVHAKENILSFLRIMELFIINADPRVW